MSLTETCKNDKIEVVVQYKADQVSCATLIDRDGVEVTRSLHRHFLHPGSLDENDALVDTDLSGEDADVQAIATAAWTTEVKEAWRLKLVADKEATPGD